LADHSQISIWRNWQQTSHDRLSLLLARAKPDGQPIAVDVGAGERRAWASELPPVAAPKVNLVLPTSLCSGQIARLATEQLNKVDPAARYATLVHTEGCGVAFASTQAVYAETMVGYAAHPLVDRCLFLEHGCEKAHNDYLRSLLREAGLAPADFGWASVQLDGGIQKALAKMRAYFADRGRTRVSAEYSQRPLTLAMLADGEVPDRIAESLARVAQLVLRGSGSVVVPDRNSLLAAPAFRAIVRLPNDRAPSLLHGQAITVPGFHIMEAPTTHWTENITGLGATGAALILTYTAQPRPGHPFIPLLRLAEAASHHADLSLTGEPATWPVAIRDRIAATLAGVYQPIALAQNNVDFQLTRGWLGIST
jgi:hypothetical protein